MCGRYSLGVDVETVRSFFGVEAGRVSLDHRPRYNVAPGQSAPVVARDADGLKMGSLRWGLSFQGPSGSRSRLAINARSETVDVRPAFRESFRRRRCVVPADGFYEWAGRGTSRRPFWIRPTAGRLLAMAAVWDRWSEGAECVYGFAILTRAASPAVEPIHSRMPVLLDAAGRAAWLDRSAPESALRRTLDEFRHPALEPVPVSTWVNSPANEGPRCVAAAEEELPAAEG